MKFRKKPVEIEAEQYWHNKTVSGVCYCMNPQVNGAHVHTLEGPLKVSNGDWIIKGVRGEFYPVKDDIFRETYEAVNE